MIPVKIVVDGDLVRGKELIGFAKDQMRILQRQMSFQKLNEGNRQVQPFPGVLVECWSSYSLKEIYIYVEPPKPSGGEPIIPPKEERYCPCFPHFTLGKIVTVIPELSDPLIAADITFLETERFMYDVEICDSHLYILFEGVYSTGWEMYNVNQMVVVGVANNQGPGTFDCDRNCVLDAIPFEVFVVAPFYLNSGMDEWLYRQSS